jgi:heat shock protein HslJ
VLSKKKTDYLEKQVDSRKKIEKNWVVSSFKAFKNTTTKNPYFIISKGKISGNTGCNDFEGNLQFNSDGLFNINRLNATKKYCKPFMKLEEAFMQSLSKASQYTIEADRLTILDKTGNTLFIAHEVIPSKLNGNWTVTTIEGFKNNTNKKVSFYITDGQIKGKSGCNTFGGSLKINTLGVFVTNRIMATKMYCETYMALEHAFLGGLGKAKTYRLKNGQLQVFNKADELIFTAINAKKTTVTTVIEYNTYSKKFAIRNKLIGKELTYYDLQPIPTKPSKVILSKEDYAFVSAEIEKLEINTLSKLVAPSTKFKENLAFGATLIVTKNGKLVRVPTFDHGNPPKEIKALIDRIMLLRK